MGLFFREGFDMIIFSQTIVPVIYQIILLSLDILLQLNIFKTQTCDCYHHETFGVYPHSILQLIMTCPVVFIGLSTSKALKPRKA